MVHNLLQRHGHLFTKEAIAFAGVHEEFLMDSMLLSKHALNETPIRLIKNALEFISELIPYEKQWRLEHQQSMINLMVSAVYQLDIQNNAYQLMKQTNKLKFQIFLSLNFICFFSDVFKCFWTMQCHCCIDQNT